MTFYLMKSLFLACELGDLSLLRSIVDHRKTCYNVSYLSYADEVGALCDVYYIHSLISI